ncbi:MAG: hypothetical protein WBE58_14040 [Verrucomicrobiales bacterium]
MNERKMACMILLLAIAGLAFGTQKMRGRMLAAESGAETSKMAANTAMQERTMSERSLADRKKKSMALLEFYHSWVPHLRDLNGAQSGERKVVELIKESNVFPLSQKFDEDKKTVKGQLIPKSLKATLVLEDDYAKTLNFLGALEEKVPACRVDHCFVSRGGAGNDIHVELTVQIPMADVSKLPPQ